MLINKDKCNCEQKLQGQDLQQSLQLLNPLQLFPFPGECIQSRLRLFFSREQARDSRVILPVNRQLRLQGVGSQPSNNCRQVIHSRSDCQRRSQNDTSSVRA